MNHCLTQVRLQPESLLLGQGITSLYRAIPPLLATSHHITVHISSHLTSSSFTSHHITPPPPSKEFFQKYLLEGDSTLPDHRKIYSPMSGLLNARCLLAAVGLTYCTALPAGWRPSLLKEFAAIISSTELDEASPPTPPPPRKRQQRRQSRKPQTQQHSESEPEPEGEEEDEPTASQQSSQPASQGRREKKSFSLTEEQEHIIVEWLTEVGGCPSH